MPIHVPAGFPSRSALRSREPELMCQDPEAVGTAGVPPSPCSPPPVRWGGRGGHARVEEGCPRRRGAAGSCSISTAGSRRCCFHF